MTERSILIGHPRISSDNEGHVTLSAKVTLPEGKTKDLWYRVDPDYGEFWVAERADAFLVGLLPFIALSGGRVRSEAPVSAHLLHNLRNLLSPLLPLFSTKFSVLDITAEPDDTDFGVGRRRHVGTGISCGIDSLATIASYTVPDTPASLRVDTLCFFNLGSHGEGGNPSREKLKHRQELAAGRGRIINAFADRIGLPLVRLASNIHEFSGELTHINVHTFRNMSAVLAMQKLFSGYHYASTYRITDFRLSIEDCAHADEFLLRCLETESTRLYSSLQAFTRQDRTRIVAGYPPAADYLNVCVKATSNCGRCFKCVRTLYQLDACGMLDRFAGCFDLSFYRGRPRKVLKMLAKDAHFRHEFLEVARSSTKPPFPPFALWVAFGLHAAEEVLLKLRKLLFGRRR